MAIPYDEIGHKIVIDPEFEKLIPPLEKHEYDLLYDGIFSISQVLDPLIVWDDIFDEDQEKFILLDGHHRFKIANELDLPFEVEKLHAPDREYAKQWMIRKQLGRRNLDPKRASVFRAELYESRKKTVSNPDGIGGWTGKLVNDQNDHQQDTDTTAEVAKESGVSRPTITRDRQYNDALNELGIKDDVIAGKKTPAKAEVIKKAKELKKGKEVSPITRQSPYVNTPDPAKQVKKGIEDFKKFNYMAENSPELLQSYYDQFMMEYENMKDSIEGFQKTVQKFKEKQKDLK